MLPASVTVFEVWIHYCPRCYAATPFHSQVLKQFLSTRSKSGYVMLMCRCSACSLCVVKSLCFYGPLSRCRLHVATEVATGLQEYFDVCLPKFLLYRHEIPQVVVLLLPYSSTRHNYTVLGASFALFMSHCDHLSICVHPSICVNKLMSAFTKLMQRYVIPFAVPGSMQVVPLPKTL